MKKIILFAMSAIMLAACTKQQSGLTITAEGNNNAQGYAFLSQLGGETIDSALIADGAFTMHLPELDPAQVYQLSIPSLHMKEFIFAEEGQLHLDMSADQLTGAPMAEELSRIFSDLEEAQTEDEYVGALRKAYDAHKEDLIGSVVLYYLAFEMPVEEAFAMYESASDIIRNTAFMQKTAAVWEVEVTTSAGHPMVDFAVEYEGKTTRLSDFVGNGRKLTIVDFWASWCGPCKREIPFLIDVYNRYKDQGVEVVGVATWDEPEATLGAIEKLGIPYPQIINAQRAGSDAYGIQGIPEIMLIGADGTILARGLRGQAIEEAIRANL